MGLSVLSWLGVCVTFMLLSYVICVRECCGCEIMTFSRAWSVVGGCQNTRCSSVRRLSFADVLHGVCLCKSFLAA